MAGDPARRIEMEMRIAAPDAVSTGVLAERLTAILGNERVSLEDDRRRVDVRVEGDTDGAVVRVLEAVERWLDQARIGSAEMWLGERSYRLARWAPVETRQ
jgi:hypothetical protein